MYQSYSPRRGVYLIHFDAPYKHARHYIGYADDITRRLVEHQTGHAGPLTRAVCKAGIVQILARTWPGAGRVFERGLHNYKNTPKLCPICNPNAHKHTGCRRMPKGYKDPF